MVPKLFENFVELEFGFLIFYLPAPELGLVCSTENSTQYSRSDDRTPVRVSFKKSKLIFKIDRLFVSYGPKHRPDQRNSVKNSWMK